jgi:hypothetical protein
LVSDLVQERFGLGNPAGFQEGGDLTEQGLNIEQVGFYAMGRTNPAVLSEVTRTKG